MARTLQQIKREMEKLEREAERVKASEVAGVVQRIKTAIDFYELTKGDLFGSKSLASPNRKKNAAGRRKAKPKKVASPAKYKDKESSKTWTGHGKRPGWFVKAIEGGMKAEEMAV